MKHEDFNSLDLTEVMAKVMDTVRSLVPAAGVHWISARGLEKLAKSSTALKKQVLHTEDMLSLHLRSQPSLDLAESFKLWNEAAQFYAPPWASSLPAHWLSERSNCFVFPLYFGAHFLGLLAIDGPSSKDEAVLAEKLKKDLAVSGKYVHFAYQYAEARSASYLDEVTSLFNQRYLPMVLDHQIAQARRDAEPFSLLFLDIDFFKKVNDSRGHLVGSRLLKLLAAVLKNQVRSTDYCFRYGGDEFVVLLGRSGARDARVVAERIRKAISGHNFKIDGEVIHLTVSIGLATFPEHAESTGHLLQLADRAMYDGKQKGRDIVYVASELK